MGRQMPSEGRFIDVGGRTLYARQTGAGRAVVLNGGAGRGIESWTTIEPLVAEFATVITYDRAGVGRSPAPSARPTAQDMVADLRGLLVALGTPRDVILVGWSLSALLAQLYACTYPAEVGGLVLLDPTPDESLAGVVDAPPAHLESMRAAMMANVQKSGLGETAGLEVEGIFESCQQVRRAVVEQRRMPDIDVLIVTAGIATQVGGRVGAVNLSTVHRRMAARVARGRHIVAPKSTHQTMITEEPDIIVEAIRSVVMGER